MGVRFVLGRSGTGKTRHCIDAVTAALRDGPEGEPLVLLVPEQASFQAERAILSHGDIAGFSRLQVLSFDRLTFLSAGSPQARQTISRVGREMIVYSILRQCRVSLSMFSRAADTAGLARHLARIIVELHQSAKEPQDVRQFLAELAQQPSEARLTRKIEDIAVVYEHYRQFLDRKADLFLDPEQQLTHVQHTVADCPRLRGARLWVDGFAGFTQQEQAILVSLIQVSTESEIALCLDPTILDLNNTDPNRLDPNSLFLPTEKTYCDLLATLRRARIPIRSPLALPEVRRFDKSSALGWIERLAFDPTIGEIPETVKRQAGQQVQIVTALDPRAEAEAVVRRIRQLVRGGGYRYRDIAVVVSDLKAYQPYLEGAFADAGIPCFLDRPRSIQQHPMIEMIRNGFTAVLEGFHTRDVIAWLKSPLGPVDPDSVALLENYCLAFGINRSDWTNPDPWPYTDANLREDRERQRRWDLERIHAIRRQAVDPLLEVRDKLGLSGEVRPLSAEEFVRAVWGLMDRLQIPRKLDEMGRSCPQQAVIHRQLFDKLVDLLDEFTDIFHDQPMEPSEQFFVLRAAMGQLVLKQIPPMIDQVLVGSIERSRHPDLKAVFLIGATQKQFPVPLSEDPILSESDRQAAARHRFFLLDRTVTQTVARQYLAYIAFTRPSERLVISFPRMDSGGSEAYPSRFVQILKDRLGLKAQTEGFDQPWDSLSGPLDLQDRLSRLICSDQRDARELGLRLLRHLPRAEHPELAAITNPLCGGLAYQNVVELDANLIRRRWPKVLPLSATRVESFARCPYQFFSRYLLELRSREVLRLEPPDLGNLYHRVLERLFYELGKDKLDIASASDEVLRDRTAALFDDEIRTHPACTNLIRHSRQDNWRIQSGREILCDAVLNMAGICRAGVFRPIAAEAGFGPGEKQVRIELDGGGGIRILLCGSIDRIDAAVIDGTKTAIVFDYKLRGRFINWSHLAGRIDLQLPIYLIAAGRIPRVEQVAGAFFLPIELKPPKQIFRWGIGPGEKDEDNEAKRMAKAVGVFDGRFAHSLDPQVSQHSKYYNFFVSQKDGPFGRYGTSGALRPHDFAALLTFTERVIRETAQAIVSGEIAIRPYRFGNQSPCSQCEYRAVCKFDWQINEYRSIVVVNKTKFLDELAGVEHG